MTKAAHEVVNKPSDMDRLVGAVPKWKKRRLFSLLAIEGVKYSTWLNQQVDNHLAKAEAHVTHKVTKTRREK
jgi:hypothetical protein